MITIPQNFSCIFISKIFLQPHWNIYTTGRNSANLAAWPTLVQSFSVHFFIRNCVWILYCKSQMHFTISNKSDSTEIWKGLIINQTARKQLASCSWPFLFPHPNQRDFGLSVLLLHINVCVHICLHIWRGWDIKDIIFSFY